MTVVLSEYAELSDVPAPLLASGRIRELWKNDSCSVADVIGLFSGGQSISTRIGTADETIVVPKATSQVVLASVATAIEQGLVWYRDGDISLWQESVPDGVLRSDGRLFTAPSAIDPQQLTIKQLPDAWDIDRTTPARLVEQLKTRDNIPYPWPLMRHAINAAIQVNLIRVAPESQPWTGSISDANGVVLTAVATAVIQQGLLSGMPAVTASAPLSADGTLTIDEVQDLSEVISALNSAAASLEGNLSIAVRLTVKSEKRIFSTADAAKLNEALGSISRKLSFKR